MSEAPGGVRARIARRPRLWGAAFALLLLAAYVLAIRPTREATARHVVAPILQSVDTPRARTFDVAVPRGRAEAVFAVPKAGTLDDKVVWAAPAGVIFLLPAMFLLVAFPTRPYWLWLLGYHLALGVTTTLIFAVGLGWWPVAFDIQQFARTYISESVSLTVPLLLFLAGKAKELRGA